MKGKAPTQAAQAEREREESATGLPLPFHVARTQSQLNNRPQAPPASPSTVVRTHEETRKRPVVNELNPYPSYCANSVGNQGTTGKS